MTAEPQNNRHRQRDDSRAFAFSAREINLSFAAFAVLLVGFTSWSIWAQREDELQRAAAEVVRLAQAVGERVGHALLVAGQGLDSDDLTAALPQLNSDPRTVVRVTDADGRILVRQPDLESAFSAEAPTTQSVRAEPAAAAILRTASAADGVERLYADTHATAFPLKVTVGVPTEQALSVWRKESIRKTTFAATVMLLAALVYAVQLSRHRRLARTDARFQHLFRASPLPAAVFSLRTDALTDANAAFCELMRCERHQVLGMTAAELGLWTPDHARDDRRLEAGGVQIQQATFRTASGELRIGSFRAQLYDEEGRELLLFVQDVTEQQAARDQLERGYQRLLAATQSASLGVWDWDVHAGTLLWDEAMYRIYGIAAGGAVVDMHAWEALIHPDDRASASSDLRNRVEAGGVYDAQFRIQCADGEVRHIKAHGDVRRTAPAASSA